MADAPKNAGNERAAAAAALFDMPRYRPLKPGKRLAIAALGVGTAWGIVALLVGEPGGARRAHDEAARRALAAPAASAARSATAAPRTSAPEVVMPVRVVPAASEGLQRPVPAPPDASSGPRRPP